MYKKNIMMFILMLLSAFAFAGSKKVALVYNNATGVNRHAFQFIMQNKRQLGSIDLQSVDASRDQPPSDVSSYILLNSGVSSGIDPVLASFRDKIPSGARVIQLNLYRGRQVGNVDVQVDAITSATLWGSRQARNMHAQWIRALAGMLGN